MKKLSIILFVLFCMVSFVQNEIQGQTTDTDNEPSLNAAEDTVDTLIYVRPDYQYNVIGKRDPFTSLVPIEEDEDKIIKGLFVYEEAIINGIVNSENDSYALVVDNNGASYVLHEGDRVFGGYVTQITDDALYMHIVKYGRAMRIVMSMESSQVTEIEESGSEITIRRPGINILYEKGQGTASRGISIEDISVPSLDVKTIEELWFGSEEENNDLPDTTSDSDPAFNQDVLNITDPTGNKRIRLPYTLKWPVFPAATGINGCTLMIDDDADFSTPLFIENGIKSTSYLMNDEMELPSNQLLYWTVIARRLTGPLFEIGSGSGLSFIITER